jgi:hypothetical protein
MPVRPGSKDAVGAGCLAVIGQQQSYIPQERRICYALVDFHPGITIPSA